MSTRNKFSNGYALLIGVGHYKEDFLSVPVTAQDADDLGHILTSSQFCAYPENQVVVFTAWGVRRNGSIGLIKGRGGSDGSLVAVSDVLLRKGYPVDCSVKITDVHHIQDGAGRRVRSMDAGRMIRMLDEQGSWPIQRYALEKMRGGDVTLGVTHYSSIFQIGTYISGGEI